MKVNIKMKANGLTKDEIKTLHEVVRKIDQKRRRDNKPRLSYKLKLGY